MPIVQLYGEADVYAFEATAFDTSNEDYVSPLQDLLPYGPAWTRRPGSYLQTVLRALSREPSRVEAQAARLIEESDPRTTQELLAAWEEFAGLPGCGDPPSTVEGRQVALSAKLTQRLSPTPDTFKALAEGLGYTDVIVTRSAADPLTPGSTVGDSLYAGQWYHTFTIYTAESTENDAVLRCLVNQILPRHSTVIFNLGAWADIVSDMVLRPDMATSVNLVSGEVPILNNVGYDAAEDAWTFDGTQRVTYPSILDVSGSPLTVSLWYKTAASPSGAMLFNIDTATALIGLRAILTSGASARHWLEHYYDTTNMVRASGVALDGIISEWTHIVYVFSGTGVAASSRQYVNGVQVSSYTTTVNGVGTPRSLDGTWEISGAGASNLNGSYTDLRVYTTEKSNDEIGRMYAFGKLKGR